MHPEYPSEADIKAIEEFKGKPLDLASLVCTTWKYEDYAKMTHRNGKTYLRLATGGWSGNEEVIYALQGTMFWAVYWHRSTRGGLYEFIIEDESNFVADWGKIIKKEVKKDESR